MKFTSHRFFSAIHSTIIMGYGDNRGHKYEKMIAEILSDVGVHLASSPAGSTDETDLEFIHRNKRFRLEMKNNAVGPDWGQVALKYRDGKWMWSESKKRQKIIEIYNDLELEGVAGVLNYLNSSIVPNMGRVEKIGKAEREEDLRLDKWFAVSPDALEKFYHDADYIQVGNGYGFYHIVEDRAGLGTEKIAARFNLRLRFKAIHNHHNRCRDCGGRYRGSYKKCDKCGRVLSTKTPTRCTECGEMVEYSDFIHVYDNYGFFAVLKCVEITNRSKYNIESGFGQDFPPISS